jgi:hypothetical protein
MCVGILMSAATLSAATRAAAQVREAESQITVQGAVTAVDHKARTVTIKLQGDSVVTLDVPANATRFEQVKVGDAISATYFDHVTVRLKKPGDAAVDTIIEPVTATPGSLPGATKARQRMTTVTITGWDAANKVLSFKGPNGYPYTRKLLDSTDAKIVAGLKAGDRVDVLRTEAVTVTVVPPKK